MSARISLVLLSVTLVLAGSPAGAAELEVDAVIERYVEAVGGRERIRAVRNLVFEAGLYEEGDYSSAGDATMSLGRPFHKLVGDKNAPGGYMEGYDGSAWEWFADPGVVIRTVGAASAAIRHYAGVEHPLVDYREKGSTAVLAGEVELDGQALVAVDLTRRDGFEERFYLDPESWLIAASGSAAPIHAFGEEVSQLTRITDYRDVGGVLIPHRFTTVQVPSGEELSSMQWGRIEANRDLPDDWFSPPRFERTPRQRLVEQLYGQRADIDAVMWTYDEYRRAHPGDDLSAELGVAGFQILKMGDVASAVTLLRRNVEDHPASADAHFGLGRALRTAGREDEARAAFAKALELDPEHRRAGAALESPAR